MKNKPFEEYINSEITIQTFIDHLKNDQGFSFSRYGDGEFYCMMGEDGSNCDGHEYFEDLGIDLELSLGFNQEFGESFYYGLVPIAVHIHGDHLETYIKTMVPAGYYPEWVSGNILMDANRKGEAGEFFSECKKHSCIYVGNERLKYNLQKDNFLNIVHWIEVPLKNAWLHSDQIFKEIVYSMIEFQSDMVCFSAGMMSKVLIWRLNYFLNPAMNTKIIDFGSMFDGYYGFNTRKYHDDYDWDKIREMNLP